jgi:hypothetical protein
VYLDGTKVGQGCGSSCGYTNTWGFTGLRCSSSKAQYTVGVEALDAAGNVSPRSSLVVRCKYVAP